MDVMVPLKAAAQRLGISVWTLRAKVRQKQVEYVRVGKLLMIPSAELDRVVNEGRRARVVSPESPQDASVVSK